MAQKMNKYDLIGGILFLAGLGVTSYFVLNEIEPEFFAGLPLIMLGGAISIAKGKWKSMNPYDTHSKKSLTTLH